MVIITPHIDLLTLQPVPVREEVQDGLVGPLTLIHIIYILRLTCQIDDTEVTAACREGIGSRLTNIVETCPDKLTAHIGGMLHHIPGLFMGT